MKLSIIVPVYNMEQGNKLRFCLDSLLNQTISEYEIIAVDDASTDGSLTILREYEKKYSEKLIIIASKENRKQGGAKNLGLHKAQGDWVGFVDSDDWIAPQMYQELLRKAEETGADVVGCDYTLVNNQSFETGKIVQNNALEQTGDLDLERRRKLVLSPGSMVIKIFKRSVIVSNNLWFPEHIFYEDNCASPLWMLYFKKFEKVEKPMYYYYQYNTSTVHTISEERCFHRMKACKLFLEECKSRGFYENFKEEIEYRFTELFLKNTLFSLMQSNVKVSGPFLETLRKEMLDEFPDFEENSYYQMKTDAEEKKLLHLFMRSPRQFVRYYKALYFYRRVRYGNKT